MNDKNEKLDRNDYDETADKLARAAIRLELEKRKIRNDPIAVYDKKTKAVYMEYSDGTRELVASDLRRERPNG